jgi:hypothetical protein
MILQRRCWAQPKRDSLCPRCLSSFTTEHTEGLSGLCVEVLTATEDTEALKTEGEIFACSEET